MTPNVTRAYKVFIKDIGWETYQFIEKPIGGFLAGYQLHQHISGRKNVFVKDAQESVINKEHIIKMTTLKEFTVEDV